MKLGLFLFSVGILGSVQAQQGKPGTTSAIDLYTALVQVNIRCVNDPVNGLLCAAEYPDQCKEQWNFPNPCTQSNLDRNITKFVHPFDKTKFLMCGQLGKLYVVQCPQYEVFHEGCGQCVGEEAGLTASCEIPLTPQFPNPCTREAILANKLFYPFPGNLSKFIHCDIWGKPWERICTPGEVWSQWDVTCVLPHLLNPCNRQTTDLNYYYKHPCDPAMYLACDAQGRAHEVDCPRGEAYHETNQRCMPYSDFKGQVLSSFCENYMFGFRKFHGNKGLMIDPSRTAETVDLGLTPDAVSQIRTLGGGLKSLVSGQQGLKVDKTTKVVGGTVTFSRDTSGQDFTSGAATNFVDVRGKSVATGPGTAEFVDIRGKRVDGTGTNLVDIRRVQGSQQTGGNMVDIRSSGSASAGQGTGGSSSQFLDIRSNRMTSKGKIIDVSGQEQTGSGTNFIDIRGTSAKAAGQSQGQVGAESNFVDIRGKSSGSVVDAIGGQNQGQTGSGAIFVDIRGSTVSGSFVDGTGGQDLGANFVDTKGTGSGSAVDATGGRTQGQTSSGAFFVDVRGSTVSGSLVDGTGGQGSGANFVDIRSTGSGTAVKAVEGQNQGQTGSGASFVDIRDSTTPGSSVMNFVDIRGSGSGTQGQDQSGLGANFVDVRGWTGTQTDSLGVMGDMTSQGATTDTGFGQGGASAGFVDIRGGQAVDMSGTSGIDMGMTGIDTTIGGFDMNMTDFNMTEANMTDFGMTGSSDFGMTDQPGSSAGFTDIRGMQTVSSGPIVDRATGTGMDGGAGFVDVRGSARSGSGGADSTGFVDIRGSRQFGSSQVVDMTGTGTDTAGGPASADVSGGVTDTSGGLVDMSGSFTDIRQGSGTQVDMSGTSTADMSATGPTVPSTWVDIRAQGQNQGMTGSDQWVDIRTLEQQQQQPGSGQATGAQTDISSITTLDLRRELGLQGGEMGGNRRVDASGRFTTNTITLQGQGQGKGSTMQELLNTWNQIVKTGTSTGTGSRMGATGSKTTRTVVETPQNVPGNGKLIDPKLSIHPSQLRMYEYSEIPFSEPCTQENLEAGRTHFRYRDHPHMFLQCDGNGRMFRMPCSTVGRDWFDVYTNTCVDGPVHVDTQILKR